MLVLIIDDDGENNEIMEDFLRSKGANTRIATTGRAGVQLVQELQPDLIVLDIILPDMSGLEVCRQIRAFSDVPVLMVSAFARENGDVIRGFEQGADDYLPKPLNLEVLWARLEALLRRSWTLSKGNQEGGYTDAYLTINLARRQVSVRGEQVKLSATEYRLLEMLVRNADQTVPALEIVEELWPGVETEKAIQYVYVYVGRLRRAIEPDPHKPRYILTEYGLGYRFCSQVWR